MTCSANGKELLSMLLRSCVRMYCLARVVKLRRQVMVLVGAFLILGVQHAVGETVSSTPPPTSPTLRVDFQNGLLSVEAKEGPWPRSLSEMREKPRIALNVSMPLTGTATVSFTDLPLDQALTRLFGPDTNFAIFYPSRAPASTSPAVPYEVWVLGKGSGEA